LFFVYFSLFSLVYLIIWVNYIENRFTLFSLTPKLSIIYLPHKGSSSDFLRPSYHSPSSYLLNYLQANPEKLASYGACPDTFKELGKWVSWD